MLRLLIDIDEKFPSYSTVTHSEFLFRNQGYPLVSAEERFKRDSTEFTDTEIELIERYKSTVKEYDAMMRRKRQERIPR
jgi:hypothetical protein